MGLMAKQLRPWWPLLLQGLLTVLVGLRCPLQKQAFPSRAVKWISGPLHHPGAQAA